jgi:hypothetical protein
LVIQNKILSLGVVSDSDPKIKFLIHVHKTIYLIYIACYNFIVYKIGGFEESTVPSKEAM